MIAFNPGRFPLLLAVVALLGTAVARAVVGRHELDESVYELLPGQAPFAALARVEIESGCCGVTGSGVLLNDQWLLTAAHLVWGNTPDKVNVAWSGTSREVTEIRYAGEWLGKPSVGLDQGGDLALLRLGSPFGFAGATALAGGSLDDRFAVLMGFGKGGNGVLGAFGTYSARGATNMIDRQFTTSGGGGLLATDFDGGNTAQNSLNAGTVDMRYYDDGFSDPLASEVLLGGTDTSSFIESSAAYTLQAWFPGLPAVVAEGTTARGDSGGPLYVYDAGTGTWQLAGITSWGFNPTIAEGFSRYDSRYGDVSVFTDLSRHRGWISANVPEPCVSLLLAGGLGLGLWRRRPCRGA